MNTEVFVDALKEDNVSQLIPDQAEESAQGHDLFRGPGEKEMIEDAREQAEASGWIPPTASRSWEDDPTSQITRRRRDLYESMQRLEAAAARASGHPDWRPEMTDALAELVDTIESHTSEIESAGGLFEQVVDRAPQLAPVVEGLRSEHRELEETAAASLAESRSDADPAQLRGHVLRLLGLLATHRQTGAEMLYDAYNVDIGPGD